MPGDLDIRLLRHFLAVAEELHFGRAAQRLFVAQQALSRDLRRLEERLGTQLLVRSTRRVELTSSGHRLLPRARELVALHDSTVRHLRDEPRPLTVDVVGSGLTPTRVLAAARRRSPDVEFYARFHTGAEPAVPLLLSGQLDITFGRCPDLPDGVRQRIVRRERLAVLLPDRHRLAALDAVPLASMRGCERPCIRSGDHVTPGWNHAVRQLLGPDQVEPAGFHPYVQSSEELARHLDDRNVPILTLASQPVIPGAVVRPIVEPVALFPWAMMWRADVDPGALRLLDEAVDELAAAHDWLSIPPGAWIPDPEADDHVNDG